jgi:hypothetical protein
MILSCALTGKKYSVILSGRCCSPFSALSTDYVASTVSCSAEFADIKKIKGEDKSCVVLLNSKKKQLNKFYRLRCHFNSLVYGNVNSSGRF